MMCRADDLFEFSRSIRQGLGCWRRQLLALRRQGVEVAGGQCLCLRLQPRHKREPPSPPYLTSWAAGAGTGIATGTGAGSQHLRPVVYSLKPYTPSLL